MSKEFIKRLLRENINDDVVTSAAVISSRIREAILRQGFMRVSQQRTEDRFINEYKNGLETIITTQVYWGGGKVVVFIKLASNKRNQMTSQEVDRLNGEYTKFFDTTIKALEQSQGLPIEFHIDRL